MMTNNFVTLAGKVQSVNFADGIENRNQVVNMEIETMPENNVRSIIVPVLVSLDSDDIYHTFINFYDAFENREPRVIIKGHIGQQNNHIFIEGDAIIVLGLGEEE